MITLNVILIGSKDNDSVDIGTLHFYVNSQIELKLKQLKHIEEKMELKSDNLSNNLNKIDEKINLKSTDFGKELNSFEQKMNLMEEKITNLKIQYLISANSNSKNNNGNVAPNISEILNGFDFFKPKFDNILSSIETLNSSLNIVNQTIRSQMDDIIGLSSSDEQILSLANMVNTLNHTLYHYISVSNPLNETLEDVIYKTNLLVKSSNQGKPPFKMYQPGQYKAVYEFFYSS